MSRKSLSVLVAGLAVLAVSVNSVSAQGAKGTGVVKGKVIFDGAPPAMKALPPMNADKVCVQANPKSPPDQATIIYKDQGNAIPYVFVYVKEGVKDKYDAPADAAVINQKGCVYHPHVFGMVVGQTLEIKSEDPTAHNIHSLPKKNTEFNLAQPNVGTIKREGKETFNKPEMAIKFKCDVHGWMSAWCHVMTHPFFDTTKDHYEFPGAGGDANKAKWGTFEIKNLPAGEYTLEGWHETFGTVQAKVTVKDGETQEVEMKMTGKKAEGPANPSRVILASEVTGGEKSEAKKACCASKQPCEKGAKAVKVVKGE